MTAPARTTLGLITPQDLPIWVPGQVVSSSAGLNWKEVSQCTYSYQGQDVELPPMDSYMIVKYRVGSTPMDRQYDGKWTRTKCHPGHFSLLSRGVDTHWNWSGDIVVSHVYIMESLLKRIAQDLFDTNVDKVILNDILQGDDPIISHLVDQFTVETESPGAGGCLYTEALSTQLAVHLLRRYSVVCRPIAITGGSFSNRSMSMLADFVEDQLQNGVSLEQMANFLGVGVCTLNRRLRKTTGQTAYQYVQNKRLSRAKDLLKSRKRPLKEVAAACGFSDQAHMTRTFRNSLGLTPGQFRSLSA